MQRMTQGENAPDDGRLEAALAAEGDAPRLAFLVGLALLLGTLTALVGVDVADDARSGGSHAHIAVELLIIAVALAGAITLVVHLVQVRRRAHVLQGRLRQAQTEAERFREESRGHLQGLAVAIDRQLSRWSSSVAEREVALLLLKGLSHKEIAAVRGTSERTVRGQALALYRKAGLSGRAQLAAFFLEDLLIPAPPGPDSDPGPTTP
jgi:DNA-binding CsgD family transcriptional regulator